MFSFVTSTSDPSVRSVPWYGVNGESADFSIRLPEIEDGGVQLTIHMTSTAIFIADPCNTGKLDTEDSSETRFVSLRFVRCGWADHFSPVTSIATHSTRASTEVKEVPYDARCHFEQNRPLRIT